MFTLDELLLPWTPQEYLCKEYIEAKKDAVGFQSYINSFDKNKCYNLHLSLPGITDEMPRPTIIYDFFEDDIYVIRHGRYDIPFKHRHTFFEVLFVYSGTAVNTVDGIDHIINENELMIIPPNVDHALYTTGVVVNILIKKSYIKNNFFSLVPFFNSFSNFFFDSVYAKEQYKYLIIDISSNVKIQSLVYSLIDEGLTKYNEHGNLLKNSLVQCIMFLLCRDAGENALVSNEMSTTNQLVVDIVHYISENYCHVTLEEVAKKFNYSVPYLSKVISSTMNMTFKEILYKTRIDKALNILSSTNDTIEVISDRLGYGNTASFYRAFKNVIGMTPSEYRDNCRNTQYIFNIPDSKSRL